MSQLKSLAGDTAIYGISSILGRSINFLLVFLHTSIFLRAELGVFTVLYSYVAILNIVYTFGMETAFFRFVNKANSKEAFHTAYTIVIVISSVMSVLIILKAQSIANWIGYPDTSLYVIWLAVILWVDGIMAIPFARLRQENKAKLFAAARVGNILINVALQLFFLLALPKLTAFAPLKTLHELDLGIGYIILANLIANLMFIPLLWKYVLDIRIRLNSIFIQPMFVYAIPIFFMGIAGMINETLGNILLEYLLPDTFYAEMNSTAAVGVYGQTLKLSIFMMLAIQAFRYAGEPFFFKNAADKSAPELFAKVMHYFVLACLALLLLVSLNVTLLADIFLRRPEYQVALYLVPILLLGKLFYGIYVNLNVWFKITDKTIYGTYFSIAGALITIIGNFILIPVLGFLGSALVSVLCYLTMVIMCYVQGRKHYPIPYNFVRLLPYFITSVLIIVGSFLYHHPNFVIDSLARILISLILIGIAVWIEKPGSIKKATDFY